MIGALRKAFRRILLGQALAEAVARNAKAADRLDAAVREMLER